MAGSPDRQVCIWGTDSKKMVRKVILRDGVTSVCFSSDNSRIAVGCIDKYIHVFEADTLHEIDVLGAHRYYVYGVVFQPDSHEILSISLAGSVKFWGPTSTTPNATYSLLKTFDTHKVDPILFP